MSSLPVDAENVESIYANRDSRAAGLQRWTLGSALVGLLFLWLTGSSGLLWGGGAVLLLVCGSLWWMARRLMRPGLPVFRLTSSHLESHLLKECGGRLAWEALVGVELRYFQKSGSLVLTLRDGDASRNFWTGLQRNQRMLPVTMLNEAEQLRLLDLLRARMAKGGWVESDEHEVEQAFRARLKALAPIPWLTWGLVGLNGVVWALTDFAEFGLKPATAEQLLIWGGNAASEVQRGEWWRLLSATFLHSGLMHLLMNMLGLLAAGVMVERIYGRRLYALVYLGSGLCGSALSLHFAAQTAVSVGASGAVFGVTGALLVAVLQHREKLPSAFGRDTIMGLSFFILYALMQGFAKEGVDNAAHVGGLLGGAVLAWLLPERFDMAHYRRTWRRGAALALGAAGVMVSGLSLTAPAAQADQMGRIQVQRDFVAAAEAFDRAMGALGQEQRDIEAGRVSLRESDARSRTVHAPAFREVVALFERAQVPPSHPRYGVYLDLKRMSELLVESLAMESVYLDGVSEPQPADPERMAQIDREVSEVAQRLLAARESK